MALSHLSTLAVPTPGLEAAREQAIDVLRHHYAEGTLAIEAFEHRVEVAHRATEAQALTVLTADLPPLKHTNNDFSRVPLLLRESSERVPATGWTMAIFGGTERKGTWTLARHTRMVIACGGGEIDLREVKFDDGVYEIRLFCLMGGVELIVPPWVRVESSVLAIFGGSGQSTGSHESNHGGPVLRISGFVMMGGVDVSERLPGESAREAKKRLKAEAVALKAARQAALPTGRT